MAQYTIQSGDTLSSIASKYGLNWQQVYEANKGGIKNPNLIYKGQSIEIPSGSSSGGGDKVHDVGLYKFASYNASPEDIARMEDEAYAELEPYYKRILEEAEGDVNKALTRLQEDYNRGVRLKTEDVATALQRADQDYGLSTEQTQQNLQLAKDTLKYLDNIQFPLARRVLDTTYNARGIFKSGIYGQGVTEQTAEQSLQREGQTGQVSDLERSQKILDLSLERTKTDQEQGKTRYIEEADITKTRTGEDLKTQLERQKAEMERQRRLEALQMASMRKSDQSQDAQLSRQFGEG